MTNILFIASAACGLIGMTVAIIVGVALSLSSRKKPPRHTWAYYVSCRRHNCSEFERNFWLSPTSGLTTSVTCQCDAEYGRSDCPVHGPTGEESYFNLERSGG